MLNPNSCSTSSPNTSPADATTVSNLRKIQIDFYRAMLRAISETEGAGAVLARTALEQPFGSSANK